MKMFKGKRILVTGSQGMIGRELVIQLKELGASVEGVDLVNGVDLRDFELCKTACKDVDYVFHLAGIKGSPKMTKERPADFMKMLQFDTNMIFATQEEGVKRFLYTSSIAVENPQTDKYPAHAKKSGEILIEAMRIQYPETKYCIVRPSNVYGRFDNFDNPNAMVITSLIGKALKGKLEVWGDGTPIRDFINAKDVARNMIKIMEDMPQFPVNLCSGDETGHSISYIVEQIQKEFGIIATYNGESSGDQIRIMKKNWDFKTEISIEEGIQEVIEHARNNL